MNNVWNGCLRRTLLAVQMLHRECARPAWHTHNESPEMDEKEAMEEVPKRAQEGFEPETIGARQVAPIGGNG